MKPKLLFWNDTMRLHFILAKYIQDNFDCEMYSIFEIPEGKKTFSQKQKFVKFKKVWYYHDYILKTKRKPDLNYLKAIEEKYHIFLWLIATNDRFFSNFNKFYKFSYDEILLILEDEIKLYEMILDEVKPDFVLMPNTDHQHNHIFYEICKSRGIKVITPFVARTGFYSKGSVFPSRIYLNDHVDPYLPLPNKKKKKNDNKPTITQQNNTSTDKKYSDDALQFRVQEHLISRNYGKAATKYLFTKDENVKTHYTYFGRSKIKVIFEMLLYELRKQRRESFMNSNLKNEIDQKTNFVYFPLHQEIERILLLGAPFFMNQLEVIRNIANALPIDYKLCVKDHMVMNIRGWRSIDEMKKIMNLPNVILLHPSTNSIELMKKSKLVISIAGSSSLEAAFYNKPSISFVNLGMFKISSLTVLKSITDLPEVIRTSLMQKVDEKEIEVFKKAVVDNTFEFGMDKIDNEIAIVLNFGGNYANAEIQDEKMSLLIEKFKPEFTLFALKHIEKMKQLSSLRTSN